MTSIFLQVRLYARIPKKAQATQTSTQVFMTTEPTTKMPATKTPTWTFFWTSLWPPAPCEVMVPSPCKPLQSMPPISAPCPLSHPLRQVFTTPATRVASVSGTAAKPAAIRHLTLPWPPCGGHPAQRPSPTVLPGWARPVTPTTNTQPPLL